MFTSPFTFLKQAPPNPKAFVAVGTNDTVVYSANGITWSSVQTPQSDGTFWKSVAYSNTLNRFAAVSTSSAGAYSDNLGVSWSNSTLSTTQNWGDNTLTWSPQLGLFACAIVAGGSESTAVMTSPNGIAWTTRSAPSGSSTNTWRGGCWAPGLGLFVMVGEGTYRVMTSPDGITWTARTAASASRWADVAWSSSLNLLVACAYGGQIMTSPDGINWTSRTAANSNAWGAIAWSPQLSLFCCVAQSGTGNRVQTSPDGINWTARTSAADLGWGSLKWNAYLGLFAAVAAENTSNSCMTSPDGITWTTRTVPTGTSIIGLASSYIP